MEVNSVSENPQVVEIFVTYITSEGPFLKICGQMDRSVSTFVERIILQYTAQFERGLGLVHPATLATGQLCCAKYRGDGVYYRARIVGLNPPLGQLTVHFVDYGNTEEVEVRNIRTLESFTSSPLSSVQNLATEFYLAGVIPVGGQWDEGAVTYAREKLGYGEFKCVIGGHCGDKRFISIFYNNIDFAHILVQNRLALRMETSAQQTLLSGMMQNTLPRVPLRPGAPVFTLPCSDYNLPLPPVIGQEVDSNLNPTHEIESLLREQGGVNKVPILKPGSQHGVIVAYVNEGPQLFTVHLKAAEDTLNHMTAQLASSHLKPLSQLPIPGTICLGRIGNNLVCRSVVVCLLESDCKLYCVDFGNTELVPYTKLFEMPEQFLNIKGLALRFCLPGIKDIKLDERAKELFQSIVGGQSLMLNVVESEGPPLKQYGELFIKGENVLNILRAKLKAKEGKIYPPLPVLQPGRVVNVTVSYVESVTSFYVQFDSNANALSTVMGAMDEYCRNSAAMLRPDELHVGMPVCALFSTDQKWYRAQITAICGSNVTVRYVDYGNLDEVNLMALRRMEASLTRIQVQAVACSLVGFQDATTSDAVSNQFEEITLEKRMAMKVIDHFPDGKLCVELHDASVTPPMNVNVSLSSTTLQKPIFEETLIGEWKDPGSGESVAANQFTTGESRFRRKMKESKHQKGSRSAFGKPRKADDMNGETWKSRKGVAVERKWGTKEDKPRGDRNWGKWEDRGSSDKKWGNRDDRKVNEWKQEGEEENESTERSWRSRDTDRKWKKQDDNDGEKKWGGQSDRERGFGDRKWGGRDKSEDGEGGYGEKKWGGRDNRRDQDGGGFGDKKWGGRDNRRDQDGEGGFGDKKWGGRDNRRDQDGEGGFGDKKWGGRDNRRDQDGGGYGEKWGGRDNRRDQDGEGGFGEKKWGGRDNRRDQDGEGGFGEKKWGGRDNRRDQDGGGYGEKWGGRDNRRDQDGEGGFGEKKWGGRDNRRDQDGEGRFGDRKWRGHDDRREDGDCGDRKWSGGRERRDGGDYKPWKNENSRERSQDDNGNARRSRWNDGDNNKKQRNEPVMASVGESNDWDTGSEVKPATMIPAFPPLVVTTGSKEKVTLVFAEKPDDFVIQMNSKADDLANIMEQIAAFYESGGSVIPESLQLPNTPCIARYSEDGTWYRALIDAAPSNSTTGVHFVDYGNHDTAPSSDVKEITPEFLQVPLFGIQCCLLGVTPPVGEWPEDKVTEFLDLTDGKNLEAHFIKKKNKGFDVILHSEDDLLRSINEKLGATPQSLCATPEPSKPFAETTATVSYASASDSYQIPNLEPGNSDSVVITWFVNPGSFYCQCSASKSEFTALVNDIQLVYKGRSTVRGSLSVGTPVIARFPSDKVLYRAIVKEIKGQNYVVQYVDYGNIEILTPSNTWLVESRFMALPQQAVLCSLKGVKPIEEQWPKDSSDYDRLFGVEQLNCTFNEIVDGKYYVSLFAGDKNLADELIDCKLAVPDEIVAEKELPLALELLTGQQIPAHVTYIENMTKFFVLLDFIQAKVDKHAEGMTVEHISSESTSQNQQAIECFVSGSDKCSDAKETEESFKLEVEDQDVILVVDAVVNKRLSVHLFDIEGQRLELLKKVDTTSAVDVEPLCPMSILKKSLPMWVSHVDGANAVWVQKESEADTLAGLLELLYTYYEEEGKGLELGDAFEGQLCAAKSTKDDGWYRGRVMSISENEEISVLYIDYGNSETLPKDRVKELDPSFCRLHVMAQCASLCVVPENVEACVTVITNITTEKVFDVTFARGAEDIWLINMENLEINVAECLVKAGLATQIEPFPFNSATHALQVNERHKVSVSHYVQPCEIWVQTHSNIDDITSLQSLLRVNSRKQPVLEEVKVGSLCIAQFTEDNEWYRAQIVEANDTTAKVRFLDYGNEDEVDVKTVRRLPVKYCIWPYYTVKCCIAEPSESWTPDEVNKFSKILSDPEKVFDLEVVENDDPVKVNLTLGEKRILDVEEEKVTVAATLDVSDITSREGFHNVSVAHADSASKFWVQDERIMPTIDDVTEKLGGAADFEKQENPQAGVLCAALFADDEQWYRACVLEPTEEGAHVHFIDYGNTSMTTELRVLPEDLASVKPLAQCCSLHLPAGLPAWSTEADKKFVEIVGDSTQTYEMCTLYEGEPAVVKLLFNTQDMSEILKDFCPVAKCEESSEKCKVMICHVNSPSDFYIQRVSESSKLDEISERLSKAESFQPLQEILTDITCAALFPDDGLWYRGKIISCEGDLIQVVFIDYGNFCAVTEVRALPDEMSTVPGLAKHCSLKLPETWHTWSPEAVDEFHRIFGDGTGIFELTLLEDGAPAVVSLSINGTIVQSELKKCSEPESTKTGGCGTVGGCNSSKASTEVEILSETDLIQEEYLPATTNENTICECCTSGGCSCSELVEASDSDVQNNLKEGVDITTLESIERNQGIESGEAVVINELEKELTSQRLNDGTSGGRTDESKLSENKLPEHEKLGSEHTEQTVTDFSVQLVLSLQEVASATPASPYKKVSRSEKIVPGSISRGSIITDIDEDKKEEESRLSRASEQQEERMEENKSEEGTAKDLVINPEGVFKDSMAEEVMEYKAQDQEDIKSITLQSGEVDASEQFPVSSGLVAEGKAETDQVVIKLDKLIVGEGSDFAIEEKSNTSEGRLADRITEMESGSSTEFTASTSGEDSYDLAPSSFETSEVNAEKVSSPEESTESADSVVQSISAMETSESVSEPSDIVKDFSDFTSTVTEIGNVGKGDSLQEEDSGNGSESSFHHNSTEIGSVNKELSGLENKEDLHRKLTVRATDLVQLAVETVKIPVSEGELIYKNYKHMSFGEKDEAEYNKTDGLGCKMSENFLADETELQGAHCIKDQSFEQESFTSKRACDEITDSETTSNTDSFSALESHFVSTPLHAEDESDTSNLNDDGTSGNSKFDTSVSDTVVDLFDVSYLHFEEPTVPSPDTKLVEGTSAKSKLLTLDPHEKEERIIPDEVGAGSHPEQEHSCVLSGKNVNDESCYETDGFESEVHVNLDTKKQELSPVEAVGREAGIHSPDRRDEQGSSAVHAGADIQVTNVLPVILEALDCEDKGADKFGVDCLKSGSFETQQFEDALGDDYEDIFESSSDSEELKLKSAFADKAEECDIVITDNEVTLHEDYGSSFSPQIKHEVLETFMHNELASICTQTETETMAICEYTQTEAEHEAIYSDLCDSSEPSRPASTDIQTDAEYYQTADNLSIEQDESFKSVGLELDGSGSSKDLADIDTDIVVEDLSDVHIPGLECPRQMEAEMRLAHSSEGDETNDQSIEVAGVDANNETFDSHCVTAELVEELLARVVHESEK